MSHGGLSHSAAWTMVIPTRRRRIREMSSSSKLQRASMLTPVGLLMSSRWPLCCVGTKIGAVAGVDADADAAQQGRKLGARRQLERIFQPGDVFWPNTGRHASACAVLVELPNQAQRVLTVRPIHSWDVPRVMSAVRWTSGVLSKRLRIGVGR
ncbi:hypothetical protein EDB85DRAFT_1975286 [Lactarius pseudohatsudake]|nr:hypothetical protein EDB85DRAFT_1975286 [Lactarius pseudohatsudake]